MITRDEIIKMKKEHDMEFPVIKQQAEHVRENIKNGKYIDTKKYNKVIFKNKIDVIGSFDMGDEIDFGQPIIDLFTEAKERAKKKFSQGLKVNDNIEIVGYAYDDIVDYIDVELEYIDVRNDKEIERYYDKSFRQEIGKIIGQELGLGEYSVKEVPCGSIEMLKNDEITVKGLTKMTYVDCEI